MTSKQLRALIKTAKSLGVSHLKTAEFEFSLAPEVPIAAPVAEPVARVSPPLEEDDGKIPHVVEEMVSLWKMTDNEMALRMFPDLAESQEDSEEVH